MRKILFFYLLLFYIGLNVYADPGARFTELMSWAGRSERDLISAGGEQVSEGEIPFIGNMKTYRILKEYGGYIFTLIDSRITRVEFNNAYIETRGGIPNHPGEGRIRYRTENEFRTEAERFRHLAQSLNARQTSNFSTSDGTHSVNYQVNLEGIFDINLMLITYLENKEQRHFGYYQITIQFMR